MLRNYFKIAWRNMRKHKTDGLINVLGLCIAFTSSMLLLLSVSYEFSFDRFHKNGKNIYHLFFRTQRLKGMDLSGAMPAPLLPALKAAYPEVKWGVRMLNNSVQVRYKDKKIGQNLLYTDADFFNLFTFPILSGSVKAPLQELNSIVLRKGSARAIFGDEAPVGKIIELKGPDGWKPFLVSGVADDPPGNSSFLFDGVLRFESLDFYPEVKSLWGEHFHDVYIALDERTDPKTFEAKLSKFVNQYFADDLANMKRDGLVPAKDGLLIKLSLQPLAELHTSTFLAGESVEPINKDFLFLLVSIGILLIAIACVNFVNLSIGRSFTRSKEIGLRKTMGARYGQVALQFWGEALMVCGIAFLMSCLLSYLLLPGYKLLFAMHIQREMLKSPRLWIVVFSGFLGITGIAGGYPAWVMARLRVVDILKGRMKMSQSNRLRNLLIGFQFISSVLLISCMLISWEQLHFLRNKPLGYNTNQVISIPISQTMQPNQELELMRNQLASSPGVESMSGIYDNLGRGADGGSRESVLGFDYKNRTIRSNWMGVSYDFVRTLDLNLVSGRDFSKNLLTDSSGVLVNEEMAKEIGEQPVVGTLLPLDSTKPLTVIGVVKDFNYKSLRRKIEPLTLVLDRNFHINYILVRVRPDHLDMSMQRVKEAWGKIVPHREFLGSFLDENVNRQYKREEKLLQIFSTGALIAVSLSCIGLLAMVMLIITQRFKEIGIRKVLGASAKGIILIVAKDFLLLVGIATLIASPIAWYAMNQWLQGFVYRIDIEWYIFGMAGLLSMAIVLLTVGFQTLKAALANPVKALRCD
jgi:putative ABC transport system permease protein